MLFNQGGKDLGDVDRTASLVSRALANASGGRANPCPRRSFSQACQKLLFCSQVVRNRSSSASNWDIESRSFLRLLRCSAKAPRISRSRSMLQLAGSPSCCKRRWQGLLAVTGLDEEPRRRLSDPGVRSLWLAPIRPLRSIWKGEGLPRQSPGRRGQLPLRRCSDRAPCGSWAGEDAAESAGDRTSSVNGNLINSFMVFPWQGWCHLILTVISTPVNSMPVPSRPRRGRPVHERDQRASMRSCSIMEAFSPSEGFQNGLYALARRYGLDPEELIAAAAEAVYASGYVTGRGQRSRILVPALRPDRSARLSPGVHGGDSRPFRPSSRPAGGGGPTAPGGISTGHPQRPDRLARPPQPPGRFFDHFDQVFNSYHLGKGKRDASLFLDVAARLQLPPERILFIDDNAGHVQRAAALGLKVHLFVDQASCLEFLQQQTGLVFPA